MRRTSSNSESGVILPIVIILMLALTITGIAFLNAGVMEYRLAKREVHKNQAFYLAEAGVEDARFKLGQDWSLVGNYVDVGPDQSSPIFGSLETGNYEATIYNTDIDEMTGLPDEKRRIRSVGTAKEISKTVQVIVRKPPSGADITSVLESGGDVEVKSNSSEIYGNVIAAGTIDDKHDRIAFEDEHPGINKFTDPDQYFYDIFKMTKDEMKALAQDLPNHYYENAINDDLVENITWVEGGDVTSRIQSNTWTGSGILVVNGDLRIAGGTFDGVIWVTGSLEITSGNPTIRGAIFVESGTAYVDITGTVYLEHDPDAIDNAVGKVATIAWVEFWEELS